MRLGQDGLDLTMNVCVLESSRWLPGLSAPGYQAAMCPGCPLLSFLLLGLNLLKETLPRGGQNRQSDWRPQVLPSPTAAQAVTDGLAERRCSRHMDPDGASQQPKDDSFQCRPVLGAEQGAQASLSSAALTCTCSLPASLNCRSAASLLMAQSQYPSLCPACAVGVRPRNQTF